MAWTTPRTWSVNEVVTAANMNTYVSDNLSWLGSATPRAALSGNLSVSSGASFAAPSSGSWSTSANTGSMYLGSTLYHLRAPTAGTYLFTATTIFSTDATGKRGLVLSSGTNGGGTVYAEAQTEPVAGTNATALSVSAIVGLSSLADVHIGIRQSSGSSMTVATRFGGIWMAT